MAHLARPRAGQPSCSETHRCADPSHRTRQRRLKLTLPNIPARHRTSGGSVHRRLSAASTSARSVNAGSAADKRSPVAGAQVGEIDATLLTFKIRSERLVWGKQSGEPAVSGRPFPVIRSARNVPCRRPVSKYSRLRWAAARAGPKRMAASPTGAPGKRHPYRPPLNCRDACAPRSPPRPGSRHR